MRSIDPIKYPEPGRRLITLIPIWLLFLMQATAVPAADAPKLSSQETAFFENKIRPVLVQHCYKCHSAEAPKVKGELFLDSRAGFRKGGKSGPALIAGNPEGSLLIKAVRYTDPDLQ
ncbi:MAG TPA: c-type cytochrome domain-containing protein, partial [Candidatus Dormibacteraeota bacterium]|nr:c-type cytochrome domain-containing protein [Candidatus Dormibacteraeota bacterium]